VRRVGGGGDLVGGGKSWLETEGGSDVARVGSKHGVIGKVASNPCSRGTKALYQIGQYISAQLIGRTASQEKEKLKERREKEEPQLYKTTFNNTK
jgi:hypothetical protein